MRKTLHQVPLRSKAMEVFTTGQIAKLCLVAPRTISKWFDSGELKGYRLPGSDDRRVARIDLIDFLTKHGIDHALRLIRPALPTVLLAGLSPPMQEQVAALLVGAAECCPVMSLFDLGVHAADLPDGAVLDCALGKADTYHAAARLHAAGCHVLVLLGEDHGDQANPESVLSLALPAPAEAIAAMVMGTKAQANGVHQP